MKNKIASQPYAIFYTFSTFGTWLHGDKKLSVQEKQNKIGIPKQYESPGLKMTMQALQNQSVFILNPAQRKIVLNSINNTCAHFHWHCFGIHVRSNHVHCIIASNLSPEKTLIKIKAYATRDLSCANSLPADVKKCWTKHGSTKYLWSKIRVLPVLHYIIKQQGKPMAWYCDPLYQNAIDNYERDLVYFYC